MSHRCYTLCSTLKFYNDICSTERWVKWCDVLPEGTNIEVTTIVFNLMIHWPYSLILISGDFANGILNIKLTFHTIITINTVIIMVFICVAFKLLIYN